MTEVFKSVRESSMTENFETIMRVLCPDVEMVRRGDAVVFPAHGVMVSNVQLMAEPDIKDLIIRTARKLLKAEP